MQLVCQPNPTDNNITVSFMLQTNQSIFLSLTNSLGQKIFVKQAYATAGKNGATIDMSQFANGIYFITLTTATQNETIQVLKK